MEFLGTMQMTNRYTRRTALLAAAAATAWMALGTMPLAQAAEASPTDMIQTLADKVLHLIRSDNALHSGDIQRITQVVDQIIMPNIDFARMTASAVGPGWRQATPQQRQELQEQFKTLLIHTYAGALKQVNQQSVEVKPLRFALKPEDKEVTVNTVVKGSGEPVQVDYRMERAPGSEYGWKVYDLNIVGVWLVANYRPQFAQQVNSGGIQSLIDALKKRNSENVGSSN